jgi:D-3-phosphoglycerate dehydrogenase
MKLAILDDYQRVSLESADWSRLRDVEVHVFHEAFSSLEDAAQALKPFDILCLMRERTAFPRALIEKLPKLKFMSLTGGRAGSLDSAAAKERGIPISHTRGGNGTTSTVELTWGLIINAERDLERGMRNMREGKWHEGQPSGIALHGKALGLLGLGKIGSKVAAVANAFGMQVRAWSQNLDEAKASAGGAKYVGKEELFSGSDILSVHLVLSDRTRGIVGAGDIGRMKPDALLVNVSRGPLIDEVSLLRALREKKIRAALDVYDREPLPPDHALRTMENVTLTPHLGYVNEENYRTFYADTIENVQAWLAGKPVRVLNP